MLSTNVNIDKKNKLWVRSFFIKLVLSATVESFNDQLGNERVIQAIGGGTRQKEAFGSWGMREEVRAARNAAGG